MIVKITESSCPVRAAVMRGVSRLKRVFFYFDTNPILALLETIIIIMTWMHYQQSRH